MTIAACYLSSEAVILGADSTTTLNDDRGPGTVASYFNFGQKVFEIGDRPEASTLAMVTWGMGSLPTLSFRTLIAEFADHLRHADQLPDMTAVAECWAVRFWAAYTDALSDPVKEARELAAAGDGLNKKGRKRLESLLHSYSGGFCLGGNLIHRRVPAAFEITYGPSMLHPPDPEPVAPGALRLWGAPSMLNRVLFGIDTRLYEDLLESPLWAPGLDDPERNAALLKLVDPYTLDIPGVLPVRDAVDLVHASIYTTIKSIKYSQWPKMCGGPVEIAVVTADRPFRWVRHKPLDAAIWAEGSHV